MLEFLAQHPWGLGFAVAAASALVILPNIVGALAWTIVAGGVTGAALWLSPPTLVDPFQGGAIFALIGCLVVAAAISGLSNNYRGMGTGLIGAAAFAAMLIAQAITSTGLIHADGYAALVGPVEDRSWTNDVQPKDPTRLRLVPATTALYLARKAIAQDGGIGSQFQVDDDHASIQAIEGRAVWLVPLTYASFSAWTSTAGIPAYIRVDGEDPDLPPLLVKTKSPMTYQPDGWFGYDLERRTRASGIADAIGTWRFQLDAKGQPVWVANATRPIAGWSGPDWRGEILADPVTGTVTLNGVDALPDFLQVAIDGPLVQKRLELSGEYSGGGWNALWTGFNLTKPDEPTLVWGADGRPKYVTGITSTNSADQSLIALVYTDARTGKSVRYATRGGATEDAIRRSVEANQDVTFRHLKAALPQIYNIEGVQSAVVPLTTQADAFGGVAMVEIANPQQVAYGESVEAALAIYKGIVGHHDHGTGLEAKATPATQSGVVARIGRVGSDTILVQLKDADHILSGSVGDNPMLALTQPGDEVDVGYSKSGAAILPLRSFTNKSLHVQQSAGDRLATRREAAAIASRAEADGARAKAQDAELRDKLMGLDPQRLKQLLNEASPAPR